MNAVPKLRPRVGSMFYPIKSWEVWNDNYRIKAQPDTPWIAWHPTKDEHMFASHAEAIAYVNQQESKQ